MIKPIINLRLILLEGILGPTIFWISSSRYFKISYSRIDWQTSSSRSPDGTFASIASLSQTFPKFNHPFQLFAKSDVKSGSTSFRCRWFPRRGSPVARTPHHAVLLFLYKPQHVTRTRGKERSPVKRPFSLLPLPGAQALSLFSLSLSFFPSFSSVSVLWQPTGRKRDRWLGDVCMMPGAIRQS